MRYLSHAMVSIAAFVLTATLFIWTIDARVLNADVLSGELRKAGVAEELTILLPEIFTGDEAVDTPAELAEMKSKISDAVSASYVESKVDAISLSMITFMREGEPDPTLDLSDFPAILRTAGVTVDPEFDDNFSEPIQLNKSSNLNGIPKAYGIFNMMKYLGVLLFVLLLGAEWFMAEKGRKLMRVSRIFLYAGVSYLIYWAILILIPIFFGNELHDSAQARYNTNGLVDAIVSAIQGLFSAYFLGFAAVCLFITAILYVIRHLKHNDVLSTPLSNYPASKK